MCSVHPQDQGRALPAFWAGQSPINLQVANNKKCRNVAPTKTQKRGDQAGSTMQLGVHATSAAVKVVPEINSNHHLGETAGSTEFGIACRGLEQHRQCTEGLKQGGARKMQAAGRCLWFMDEISIEVVFDKGAILFTELLVQLFHTLPYAAVCVTLPRSLSYPHEEEGLACCQTQEDGSDNAFVAKKRKPGYDQAMTSVNAAQAHTC